MGELSIRNLRKDLFGGVEFSKRDLKTPFLVVSEDPTNPVLGKQTGTSIWLVPIFSGHLIRGWP